MNHHSVVIDIYIYQIGPFKFRLLDRHSTTGELYLLADNTSIASQEVPILLPATANVIGQLSRILYFLMIICSFYKIMYDFQAKKQNVKSD